MNMKTRVLITFIVLSFFTTQALGKINGYISFDYSKGQKQSDISNGAFNNARLGLIFSGDISAKINYLSEISLQEGGGVDIEQAWVGIGASEAFNIKLGLYLVPFGKYNQSNRAHQTLLIHNPLNVNYIFPTRWKDAGILVEGRSSIISYAVYLGNGLSESQNLRGGQQFGDNNADKGKGGRIGLFLSKGFEVGYSYFRGKFDDDNSRNLILQGLDLSWMSEGFQIMSEYTRADVGNPEGFSDGKAEGYFIQASFDIENLRPVVSYQRIKYTDDFHGSGFIKNVAAGEGILIEKSCWALGIVYFPSPNILIKLEYDINREEGIEQKDNIFSVQIGLSF